MTATEEETLRSAVHAVWDNWPAPPPEQIQPLAYWPAEVWTAFAGVAPMDVDLGSLGFLQATPLQQLPPKSAAAYLGTYLLSFLEGAETQMRTGLFYDLTTRAHLLSCLTAPGFWKEVIEAEVPSDGREVLRQFISYLAKHAPAFAVTPEDLAAMQAFAAKK